MKRIIAILTVGTILTLGAGATLRAEKEKGEKEESISMSQVPDVVQKTAQAEAKDGKIVRWEKEGTNYEAVVEKDGKQTGIEIDSKGKVVSRHDESKEHKEKDE